MGPLTKVYLEKLKIFYRVYPKLKGHHPTPKPDISELQNYSNIESNTNQIKAHQPIKFVHDHYL